MNPNSIRRAIGVACDIASDVATGLSKTFCAAASTLAIAVLPDEPAPTPGPAFARPPWIPAAPALLPGVPDALLRDLAAVEDGPWCDHVPCPSWRPFGAGCASCLIDGFDGPGVSP